MLKVENGLVKLQEIAKVVPLDMLEMVHLLMLWQLVELDVKFILPEVLGFLK